MNEISRGGGSKIKRQSVREFGGCKSVKQRSDEFQSDEGTNKGGNEGSYFQYREYEGIKSKWLFRSALELCIPKVWLRIEINGGFSGFSAELIFVFVVFMVAMVFSLFVVIN
ncbi:unnamed protein product [Ilex paraguariensis]|uniref:Uncharacterized protein n=1 Tax=Ilex paraguariensis TaxID=185542 RepID=A0ABC8UHU2_9AQUA